VVLFGSVGSDLVPNAPDLVMVAQRQWTIRLLVAQASREFVVRDALMDSLWRILENSDFIDDLTYSTLKKL
jgi:hypothetical protein